MATACKNGSGKTALLAYISDHAPDHGWVAVDVTASSGMLEDIMQRAIAVAYTSP